MKANGRTYTRAKAALATRVEPNYIARLVASLPSVTKADVNLDRYYALLDRVLEDRIVTPEETGRLLSLALDTGISQERTKEVHHEYIHDLVLAALADGLITEKEERTLGTFVDYSRSQKKHLRIFFYKQEMGPLKPCPLSPPPRSRLTRT